MYILFRSGKEYISKMNTTWELKFKVSAKFHSIQLSLLSLSDTLRYGKQFYHAPPPLFGSVFIIEAQERSHIGKEQKSAQHIVELIIKQSASVLIRPKVRLK